MIIQGVADTHTVIWYLLQDSQLSAVAKRFIDDAAAHSNRIAVSSITLIEAVCLVEKGRIKPGTYAVLESALADPNDVFIEAPVNAAIAQALNKVSKAEIPDMPDRIVAATAIHFGVPVISVDRLIRASTVGSIW